MFEICIETVMTQTGSGDHLACTHWLLHVHGWVHALQKWIASGTREYALETSLNLGRYSCSWAWYFLPEELAGRMIAAAGLSERSGMNSMK